jgi:ribosomal protein L24
MKSYKKKRLVAQHSFHVKRGDQVFVLSGKDKGKQGVIRTINTAKAKAIVEGINIVNGAERLIHISNLKVAKV